MTTTEIGLTLNLLGTLALIFFTPGIQTYDWWGASLWNASPGWLKQWGWTIAGVLLFGGFALQLVGPR